MQRALATKGEIFFDESAAPNPALRSPGARVFSLGLMELVATSDRRRVVDLIKDVDKGGGIRVLRSVETRYYDSLYLGNLHYHKIFESLSQA